ncbi:hypothetical protein F7725_017621, partial [Dissostichus mawsoni]
ESDTAGSADCHRGEPEDFSGETELESEGSEAEQGEKDEESQSEAEDASTSSGTSDISKCKGEPPMQPHLKLFPRTLMGDRRRSFKADWYKITPGLSTPKCQTLLIVTPSDILALRIAQTLYLIHLQVSKTGRRQHKEGGFAIHAKSERHTHAMIAKKRLCSKLAESFVLTTVGRERQNKIKHGFVQPFSTLSLIRCSMSLIDGFQTQTVT